MAAGSNLTAGSPAGLAVVVLAEGISELNLMLKHQFFNDSYIVRGTPRFAASLMLGSSQNLHSPSGVRT